MSLRDPAWLRSARARPAAFFALVLLSLSAVLVSAVTPMLLAALDATTLREGVARAELPRNGVIGITQLTENNDRGLATSGLTGILLAPGESSDRWDEPRIVVEGKTLLGVFADRARTVQQPTGYSVTLDQCEGMTLETGRCPYREWEVAAPATLARERGWRTGTTLVARVPGRVDPVTMQVVAVYDDHRGSGRILANPTVLEGATTDREVPDLVMDDSAFVVIPVPYELIGSRQVALPVRQPDVARLRRGVAAAELASTDQDAGLSQARTISDLPELLDGLEVQQTASATLMAPIALGGLILAWYALFVVAQRSARARAVEWGVDRTRGLRVRAWLGAVFTEPVIAVVVGAVLGYPAAVLVAAGASTLVLGGTADLAPLTPAALAAAALALVGSVTALGAASLRAALLPLDELLQDAVEPRRATRVALVGRVVLLTLTAAVVWAVFTAPAGSGPQLGLLLPVLLALVVGLAARLGAVVLVRRTAARVPRSLTSMIVGRGLARAPSGLAAVQLLLVAVAVAAYVLQVQAVSAAVQTDRAELALGAPEVYTVAVPSGTSLRSAVRRADPAGRTAMAAVEVGGTDAKGPAHLVAVDTARLEAVGDWRSAWRGAADPARLRAAGQQDLVLRGTELAVTTTAPQKIADGIDPATDLELSAVLATDRGWRRVTIGDVVDGTLRAAVPCGSGCRVVSLVLANTGTESGLPWDAALTITRLSTDRQPASALQPWLSGARWRARTVDDVNPERRVQAAFGRSTQGLALQVADRIGGGSVQLEPAVGPAVLPVIAATTTPLVIVAATGGAVLGNALSTETIRVKAIAKAPVLPRTLRDGVLADLGVAERLSDPSATVGTQQVWMTAGAHPGVLAALQRQGVRVLGHRDAAVDARTALASATNRALLLAGTTAVAGLLFALLALVAARIVDAPGRRREWTVLRLAGAAAPRLRRIATTQLAVPAAIAVLLGIASGVLAGALTVGGLPLLVGLSAGPPLDATPPLVALAVLAAVVLALIAVIALVAAAVDLPRRRR